MNPADIFTAAVLLAVFCVKRTPKPVRQVFPTPLGSKLGTRVFGATDRAIIERLVRL